MSNTQQNNKIYAIYLGGSHNQTNIEVHDLVFTVGQDIESCYEFCVNNWFGTGRPHLDGYFEIETSQDSVDTENKEYSLFCLNFGGYLPNQLAEIHEFILVLAKTKGEAIKQGKRNLQLKFHDLHMDECFEIDDIINISQKIDLKFASQKDMQFTLTNCYKKL